MAIDSRYRMSQERLDTLKEELHYLETTRELNSLHRNKITDRVVRQ